MANLLSDYLTDVQRLLHDSTFKFWTQQELTDYINKSRKLINAEAGCTRQLATVNIAAATTLAQATYAMATGIITTPTVRRVIDVYDIILNYSVNTTYQLRYYPFQDIIRMGIWQYQSPQTPACYTIMNQNVIILPWPQIAYPSSTFDCVVEPLPLVNTTDIDNEILFPYTETVGFYAAYLAKLKNQQRSEAESFLMDYQRRKVSAIGTEFTRRLIGH